MKTDLAPGKALKYIAKQQLASGGFLSDSSMSATPFTSSVQYETVFFPSLIAVALSVSDHPLTTSIASGVVRFLRQQASAELTFNYWSRKSDMAQSMPYPDDTDDTFCALAALRKHDSSFFDGGVLADIAHLLIDREIAPGGPYRTGFVGDAPSDAWQSVDPVVNANIAAFLLLDGIVLAPVSSVIAKAVQEGDITTQFYPDECVSAYLISKTKLTARSAKKLQKIVLENQRDEQNWGNALRTASAVNALLNVGYPASKLSRAIARLLDTQRNDGSWPAACFSIDPAIDGSTHYGGAASLTTALCYEAIVRYEQLSQSNLNQTRRKPPAVVVKIQKRVSEAIMLVEQPELREATRLLYEDIISKDTDGQILQMPWYIAGVFPEDGPYPDLAVLSEASLWGWMSYTALDDIMDRDVGLEVLPVAIFCNRKLLGCLAEFLPNNPAFHDDVDTLLCRIDSANAWELKHCRGNVVDGVFSIAALPDYGDYWQLADRSIGHAIAALGVLYATGLTCRSVEMTAVHTFFKHYLIARQLLDEAHDWQADLMKGHVNAVATLLLSRLDSKSWQGSVALHEAVPAMQSLLWTDVIVEVSGSIGFHIQTARESLRNISIFESSKLLELLKPLESAAQRTLMEREESLAFLRAF